MNPTLILYHQYKDDSPCPDGLAAAWVAKKAFPNSDIKGVSYEDRDNLDVSSYKEIVIVDFSFPLTTIDKWWHEGKKVLLIDHHKTAMEDLGDFSNQVLNGSKRFVFDMNECGATLTWKTLFPKRPMPVFLNYVKDRDIWLHQLPYTHEIHAALGAVGRNHALFDVLEMMDEGALVKYLVPLGKRELKRKQDEVEQLALTATFESLAGYENIPIVRVTEQQSYLVSDVCHLLCRKYPAAAFSAALIDGHKYSLRSDKDGLNTDVSAIAKSFGGGGHKNAAGFSL